MTFPPKIVLGKYKLHEKISTDCDSFVYSATAAPRSRRRSKDQGHAPHQKDQTAESVVVKLAHPAVRRTQSQIKHELEMYKHLSGSAAIVKLLDHSRDCLVLERGISDLKTLIEKQPDRRFSLKTALMFGAEMLRNFRDVHDRGFIWRKLKPADILFMGWPKRCTYEASKPGRVGHDDWSMTSDDSSAGSPTVRPWPAQYVPPPPDFEAYINFKWGEDGAVFTQTLTYGFEVTTEKKEARVVGNHGAFCIIDLASGIVFIDKNRNHYDYAENSEHRNYYSEFASVTQHLKVQSSRRDDIESLLYLLVKLILGDLPWSHPPLLTGPYSRSITEKYILSCKLHFPSAETKAKLPPEIIEIIEKVQTLQFDERPDYEEYMELLKKCYDKEEFRIDGVFDF
ncbi:hypothetical protein HK097_009000 [Rhizophlyctis rosea]|uniref:Protein kinase domain-containing protein n=1 Tax=Rhizophlyctis rosea TaxID=64517 RepID=A0AAD5SB62_9FUNG|nr:hypothetical protein HK097_009000 [Rhizophlyctis rosea]